MKNILDKINRADEIQANLELDKTELGKHEVELNAVIELQKTAAKIGGQILSLEMDILQKANDIKKLASQYDSFINQFKGFEIKAKELGVVTVMNQAKESIDFYQEKMRRADKYLTTIQSLTKR